MRIQKAPWLRLLMWACTGLCALAGPSAFAQLKLEAAPEYFYWREEVNGQRLLEESGFRMGVELSYKPPREQGWIWGGRVKLYGGSVDYDGGLQLPDGETIPLKATTDYFGGLVEARFGYRWDLADDYYLDALAGLGVDAWLRRLQGPGGYDEFWLPLFFKAGVEVAPRQIGWIGSVALKVPFYTSQFSKVDGTLVLHPNPMVSGSAEAGYKFTPHFSAVAFFDSYWFKESSVSKGFFQPESKSYQVGAKIGWTF